MTEPTMTPEKWADLEKYIRGRFRGVIATYEKIDAVVNYVKHYINRVNAAAADREREGCAELVEELDLEEVAKAIRARKGKEGG